MSAHLRDVDHPSGLCDQIARVDDEVGIRDPPEPLRIAELVEGDVVDAFALVDDVTGESSRGGWRPSALNRIVRPSSETCSLVSTCS
jgi:hypothetical protein